MARSVPSTYFWAFLWLPLAYAMRLGDSEATMLTTNQSMTPFQFGCPGDEETCCMCRKYKWTPGRVMQANNCEAPKKLTTLTINGKDHNICCQGMEQGQVFEVKSTAGPDGSKLVEHVAAACFRIPTEEACNLDDEGNAVVPGQGVSRALGISASRVARVGQLAGEFFSKAVSTVIGFYENVKTYLKNVAANAARCVGMDDRDQWVPVDIEKRPRRQACWETLRVVGTVAFAVAGVACLASGGCGLGLAVAGGAWGLIKFAVSQSYEFNPDAKNKVKGATLVIFGVAAAAGAAAAAMLPGVTDLIKAIGIEVIEEVASVGANLLDSAILFAAKKLLKMCYFVRETMKDTNVDLKDISVDPSDKVFTEAVKDSEHKSNTCDKIEEIVKEKEEQHMQRRGFPPACKSLGLVSSVGMLSNKKNALHFDDAGVESEGTDEDDGESWSEQPGPPEVETSEVS